MNIPEMILSKIQKNGHVTVREIALKTGLSRTYLNRMFRQLVDEGKIILVGKANKSQYVPATLDAINKVNKGVLEVHFLLKNEKLEEDKILDRVKSSTGILLGLPANITKIFNYAFTEMLNNAIEHSLSKTVDVKVERLPQSLHFTVGDQGIGIFNNIMRQRKLATALDAIGELLKGKQTTAPEAHSGEGIFFTSKVADRLIIKSSQKRVLFDNVLDDVVVSDCAQVKGTKVMFALSLESKRHLEDIFRSFSNDAFEFSKTQVNVRLFKMGQDYVSRSQARRILSGLESFETLILDFTEINGIGQAFADEIFRVWQKKFPQKNIIVRNSNENIDFMIKRAKQ
ncbi:MAG: DUF4325 domain-containing protein [Candidatus Omnitrophica bacterium]|nr:DUF4325 domain-containing protein [Candidatus Omnitrophota bacterium]